MLIQAITIFPEMFDSITEYGVTGRAKKQNLWQFQAINPRKFADNKLGYIDDRPFGGGPGMIMMAPPLQAAIEEAKQTSSAPAKVIYLSPQGQSKNRYSIYCSFRTNKGYPFLCNKTTGNFLFYFKLISFSEKPLYIFLREVYVTCAYFHTYV